MKAFYNEIDSYCCDWLSNLMDAGHITPGVICDKSIEDVFPDELRKFDRCHFFAGIGVWDYALNMARWGERPVWTGSAPCQPFSAAGKGAGFDDERHLWPAWYWLIGERRPPVIFGEQVASSAVEPWIDLVHADMEALDYPFGCVPFPSAGVGSPHIRDRAYWMAYADHTRSQGRHRMLERTAERAARSGGMAGRMGHAERIGAGGHAGTSTSSQGGAELRAVSDDARSPSAACGLADADGRDASAERQQHGGEQRFLAQDGSPLREADQGARNRVPRDCTGAGPTSGVWRDADWLLCRDGKWRPVEPGTFPLVDGAPSRVGRLRAYGNAINAEAATQFILAARDILTT